MAKVTILKEVAALQKDRPADERTVRRGDGFSADIDELHFEEGFNPRDLNTPARREYILAMLEAYKGGLVKFPPIAVSVGEKGKLIVRDGHCRTTMYRLAREQGVVVPPVQLEEVRGNSQDFLLLALNRSRSNPLTPLEIALGAKRLRNSGMTEAQIAKSIPSTSDKGEMSITRVKQLLVLADAEPDVHDLVSQEKVTADVAIPVVKEHGAEAGRYLREKLAGRTKVTNATLHGRSLPKKAVAGLLDSVSTFADRLGQRARVELASFEKLEPQQLEGKTVNVDAAALLGLLKAQDEIDELKKRRASQQANDAQAAKQTAMNV